MLRVSRSVRVVRFENAASRLSGKRTKAAGGRAERAEPPGLPIEETGKRSGGIGDAFERTVPLAKVAFPLADNPVPRGPF